MTKEQNPTDTEPQRKILLAEDDEIVAAILIKLLEQHNFQVTRASDGAQALELFRKDWYPVVITDLLMPVMDGRQFIEQLKKMRVQPVILVVSGQESVDTALEVIKNGVYDYLVKPVVPDTFTFKVESAFELSKMRANSLSVTREKELLLAQKTDWKEFKDLLLRKKFEKIDLNLFSNLKTSFSQSAGFGVLLSLIPFIPMGSEKVGDKYLVPGDLVDTLVENAAIARQALEEFDSIGEVFHSEKKLVKTPVTEIIEIIRTVATELTGRSALGRHRTEIIPVVTDLLAEVNSDYLAKAFRELLLNAYKYSKPDTTVLVVTEFDDNWFRISFINEPSPNGMTETGIPAEYSRAVFEPFFRLHHIVDERYGTFDFGIGLTMVERIVRQHHGKISASDLKDHSLLDTPSQKVQFVIELPISR